MNLQENIQRIKEMMEVPPENQTVSIKGKVLDLDNLTNDEKKNLQLKEKVILDRLENEYPIVLIQLKDGKVIVFDVNGSIQEPEKNILHRSISS